MLMKLICKLGGDEIRSWYVNWLVMKLTFNLDSEWIWNWYLIWTVMKYESDMSIEWWCYMKVICKWDSDVIWN